jgi:hypothetical protein
VGDPRLLRPYSYTAPVEATPPWDKKIYYSMGSLAVAFAFYLGQIDGLVLDEKVRNIAERVSSLSSGTVPQSDVFRQSLFRPLDFDRQFLIGIRPYRGLIGAGGIFVDLAATLIWVWVPGA